MFVRFTQPELLIPVVTLGSPSTSLHFAQFYCIIEKQQGFAKPRFMYQNLVYLGKLIFRNISYFYSAPKQQSLECYPVSKMGMEYKRRKIPRTNIREDEHVNTISCHAKRAFLSWKDVFLNGCSHVELH